MFEKIMKPRDMGIDNHIIIAPFHAKDLTICAVLFNAHHIVNKEPAHDASCNQLVSTSLVCKQPTNARQQDNSA